MSSLAISFLALVIILGGAFGALYLRSALPEEHFSDATKDVVRLGTGLVGTIAALVLGLLIAAAKGSFDTQSGHVQHLAADFVLLDELLIQYGPDANAARQELRATVGPTVDRIWQENSSKAAARSPFQVSQRGQETATKIEDMQPRTEMQRALKDRAVQTLSDIGQTRFLLFEQGAGGVPTPFLVVLIFWLGIIFAGFALFSRPNPIVITALFIFALSASGALFLVLELSQPFSGLMQISSEPLRNALAPL